MKRGCKSLIRDKNDHDNLICKVYVNVYLLKLYLSICDIADLIKNV